MSDGLNTEDIAMITIMLAAIGMHITLTALVISGQLKVLHADVRRLIEMVEGRDDK